MTTLSNELKGVILRRLEHAAPDEVLVIASALCAKEAPATPPSVADLRPRFTILDDGQVCDHESGLIWTRKDVSTETLNFNDARVACEKLRLGGSSEWRLPTIRELLSLVDYERHDPAIDTNIFNCKSSWYWTSTPLHSSPVDYAWYVYFFNGYAFYGSRNYNGWCRAVRVGQF